MQGHTALKCLCAVTCIMIAIATVSSAPSYADYDNNIRDLWEILLQREALEDKFGSSGHQVVRKSSRSPSLRLRFGRRSDPSMPLVPESAAYMMAQAVDHDNN